ncbi:hypothetical protein HYV70_01445 [Candidatus Uhrbacteria bacterium]|nr:hypothetical protein [Candidatus Uhrbacteria bacterium]
MPTSTLCTNLKSSLETIRALKTDFDAAYETAMSSGTPAEIQKAQDLKHALETRAQKLQQEVNVLEAEHLYDLRAQYESQVMSLKRTGLIETKIELDEMGKETEVSFMKDIHGNECPVPSYETIVERLAEQKEFLFTKADQGFGKFLLVPFGMSLGQMIQRFRVFLLDYKKDHPEFDRVDSLTMSDQSSWDPLSMLNNVYIGTDVNGTLIYDPKSFDANHGGVTKTQILKRQKTDQDPTLGWRLLFLQAGKDGTGFKEIPRQGKGEIQGEQLPRTDLETGKSPKKYLEDQLRTSQDPTSAYYGESGMTPEEWMVMFMSHLQETGRPMDNFRKNTESVASLTGVYLKSYSSVPSSGWDQFFSQVALNGLVPFVEDKIMGLRVVVRG